MPFLAPLWSQRPVLCLVNHMHTELWSIRFRPPFSTVGRNIERVVMPRVHRNNLFLTVSPSTAESLQQIGVGQDRIRQICNGVEAPDPPTPRSPEPMFLAFGRLADYKRLDLLLRLWDRVRHVTGGKLVIAGDGPERQRLQALAGPGVEFTGRVSDAEKHRLMCAAWLFLHPALIEGWASWSPRRRSAALPPWRSTYRACVTGLARPDRGAGADRRPVRLGVGVAGDRPAAARAARPGGAHPRAAAALVRRGGRLRRRGRRGHQAGQEPVVTVTAPANPLQEFYETPGVPLRSGPDRAHRQARMLAEMLRGFPGRP